MWHTSRGDRTLQGAEAELIAHAVDMMIDGLFIYLKDEWIEDDAYSSTSGVAIFDSLSASQRVALLHDVTKHLITPTESTFPLSAHAEAAVAAIFIEIRDQVAIEIGLFPNGDGEPSDDPEENVTWRQLVLAAHKAVFRTPPEPDDGCDFDFGPYPDDIKIPSDSCQEMEVWEFLIESLTDAVLWDRDFEMAESFLDVDPGVSQQRRRLMGIEDDYFTTVARDPRTDEVYRLVSETRAIVRAKPR